LYFALPTPYCEIATQINLPRSDCILTPPVEAMLAMKLPHRKGMFGCTLTVLVSGAVIHGLQGWSFRE